MGMSKNDMASPASAQGRGWRCYENDISGKKEEKRKGQQ